VAITLKFPGMIKKYTSLSPPGDITDSIQPKNRGRNNTRWSEEEKTKVARMINQNLTKQYGFYKYKPKTVNI
jgi:SPX domain protein involved in polyphosphate accumulation